MKPIIGIVAGVEYSQELMLLQNRVGLDYVEAIVKAKGNPVIIPYVASSQLLDGYLELCSGFLFTGGLDLNPLIYNENPHPLCKTTNLAVDKFQLELMQKVLAKNKPLLGICRGAQLLNVACKGTLYQDLALMPSPALAHMQGEHDRHGLAHEINITKGSFLEEILGQKTLVNSFHHQGIKRLGKNLTVMARSSDRVIEAIAINDHPFQAGIQWHPENFVNVDQAMERIFESFVAAAQSMADSQ